MLAARRALGSQKAIPANPLVSSAISNATGSNGDITFPAVAFTARNLLVAVLASNLTDTVFAGVTAAGFTEVGAGVTGSYAEIHVFTKIAAPGDNAGNWTFTSTRGGSGTQDSCATILEYKGAAGVDGGLSAATGGTGAPPSFTAQTALNPGELWLVILATEGALGANPPVGFGETTVNTHGAGISIGTADKALSASGSTGTTAWGASSNFWLTTSILLHP